MDIQKFVCLKSDAVKGIVNVHKIIEGALRELQAPLRSSIRRLGLC
jgi:hypothetical protein